MNQSESADGANRASPVHTGPAQVGNIDLDLLMEQIRVEVASETKLRDSNAEPFTPLNPAEIMARVREEVARRSSAAAHQQFQAVTNADAVLSRGTQLPRWRPVAPRLPEKAQYALGEFLRFDDADFVDVAYERLLRRPADASGRQGYLDALRTGAASKVEILGLIRFSEEGRRQAVHVDGLLLPYKLHQWRHLPVIGGLLSFAMAVARLPRLAAHFQRIEATAARETHELGRMVDRISAAEELRLAEIEKAINAIRIELGQSTMARLEAVRALHAQTRALQEALESQGDSLRASDADREKWQREFSERLRGQANALTGMGEQVQADQRSLRGSLRASDADREKWRRELSDRLAGQAHALASLGEQVQTDQRSLRGVLERLTLFLDASARHFREQHDDNERLSAHASKYALFEQKFRGEREEIKLRAKHYLSTLASAQITPGDGMILDIGSGRGEWLEVLREHGYLCRGVDRNAEMLESSRAHGHDVIEADALNYLRALEPGSLAAITSMHLVEHLPNEVVFQLLDESFRVLRPGGLLILETPNPENVRVGSCMFYMDPTHLRPIPPALLQWTVQSCGFEQVQIERLSEHRGSEPGMTRVSEDVPGAAQINQMVAWFTAPQDYAVIGRKPHREK